MINYEHYSCRVTWSTEEQKFVELCAEYLSLSYLNDSNYPQWDSAAGRNPVSLSSRCSFV